MNIKRITAITLGCMLTLGVIFPNLTQGITVKEEEEMSRQILQVIEANFKLVNDPVIVDYVDRIGRKLLTKFPLQPFNYRFFVVEEEVYNAFATPGGNIFMYTGLIAAMESEEELAGILSHEISHVYCRHISQKIERRKKVNIATMAGIAAGILLGAAGAGEAAGALTMGSMAAGQSAELAFSRQDEIQADQVGLVYMTDAGYNGEGLLEILNKIRAKQWFSTDQIPSYLMTHPAVEDRLAYIDTYLDQNREKLGSLKPAANRDFKIAHTRVLALFTQESLALKQFEAAVRGAGADAFDFYGYGLVLARTGNRSEAAAALKKALALEAFNADFLAALGRVYFMDGRYDEALAALQGAISISPTNPIALFFLGRTQLELGRPQEAESALSILKKSRPYTEQVYYFLGKAYGEQGKLADAHLNIGLYYLRKREYDSALKQFDQALAKNRDPARQEEIETLRKQTRDVLAKMKKASG